jgi:hypothetical protein
MATATLTEPPMTTPATTLPTEDEALYEVVAGQVMETAPMAANAIHLASILLGWLAPYLRIARLGRVECEMLYLIDTDAGLKRRRIRLL